MKQEELEAKIEELLKRNHIMLITELNPEVDGYVCLLENAVFSISGRLNIVSEICHNATKNLAALISLIEKRITPDKSREIFKKGKIKYGECVAGSMIGLPHGDLASDIENRIEQMQAATSELILLTIAQHQYETSILELTCLECFSGKEYDCNRAIIYLTINNSVHAYKIDFMKSMHSRLDFGMPEQSFFESVNLQNINAIHEDKKERVYFASNPSRLMPEHAVISYTASKLQQEYEERNPDKADQIRAGKELNRMGLSWN